MPKNCKSVNHFMESGHFDWATAKIVDKQNWLWIHTATTLLDIHPLASMVHD